MKEKDATFVGHYKGIEVKCWEDYSSIQITEKEAEDMIRKLDEGIHEYQKTSGKRPTLLWASATLAAALNRLFNETQILTTFSDEEIARSFIEDVSKVKHLLPKKGKTI